MSREAVSKAINETKEFEPIGRDRTLFVDTEASGSVDAQVLMFIDGNEQWKTFQTYAAGEGETLIQGRNTFRMVPSDDTTYFTYV